MDVSLRLNQSVRFRESSCLPSRPKPNRYPTSSIIPDFGASILICDDSFSVGEMDRSEMSGSNRRWGEQSVKFSAKNFVAQNEESLEDHYIVGNMLGEGGYGEVYSCTHIQSGEERAVKVIEKQRNEEENQMVIDEFDIVKDLDHPNILKMYALFESKTHFFLVTDLYAGGELYDELEECGSLQEHEAALLMNNVLSCINYCHTKGLVHRDLKPENILLEESKNLDDLKIIDFGLAEYGDKFYSLTGSTYYMSPQVIEGEYTEKCDIWSIGVLCFVVLGGYAPFEGRNDKETVEEVLSGYFDMDKPIWDEVSEEGKDFVRWLLSYDESERPSAQEALQHGWLKGARTQRHKNNAKRRESTRVSLVCLQSFQANSKLKQCVCSLIASQLLKKEEKEEIDIAFRTLDFDCDGKLTREDLRLSYMEFFDQKLSENDIELIFQQVNFSGSGAIEYSEFVASSLMEKDLIDDAKLLTAFKVFDKGDKGYISNEDLRDVLALDDPGMDDYIMEKIIRQVDANGDGQIQYDEFRDMMFSKTAMQASPSKSSSRRRKPNPVAVSSLLFLDEKESSCDENEFDDSFTLDMGLSVNVSTRVGEKSTRVGEKSFRSILDMFQDKANKNGELRSFQSKSRVSELGRM